MAQEQNVTYGAGEASSNGDVFSGNRDIARLFDEFFRGFGPRLPMRGRAGAVLEPEIDVCETEKDFKICADLPGVDDKDVTVTLADEVLTICAERKHQRQNDQENYHLVERSYGTMLRRLKLPNYVDADHVEASFENGVLTIRIPKTHKTQRSRKIDIRSKAGAGDGQREPGAAHDDTAQGLDPATPPM